MTAPPERPQVPRSTRDAAPHWQLVAPQQTSYLSLGIDLDQYGFVAFLAALFYSYSNPLRALLTLPGTSTPDPDIECKPIYRIAYATAIEIPQV